MKVRINRRALAQIDEIAAFIAKDNPAAAEKVTRRILGLITLISQHPGIGRPADETGVRGLRASPYPRS